MYDSILFDLDGTLWDATHVTAKIWPTVLACHPEVHRTITEADVQAYMGRTNEELASLLFPDLPYDKAFGLMMESCAVENELLLAHGGKLYPEIPKVLAALSAHYPLFIVSNCQSGYIEAFLTHHRLGKYFRDHISSGDTGKKKANNILLLRDKHDLQSSLYVGDTRFDEEAARASGCDFCYVTWGFGSVSAPDYTCRTPMELCSLLIKEEIR